MALSIIPELPIPIVTLDNTPSISTSPGWVSGTNVILEQKEMAGNLVTAYDARLVDVADQMATMIIDEDKPDGWDTLLDDVVINPVPGLDLGTIPAPGGITLPGFDGLVFPTLGTLREIPAIDLDWTDPTAPADVDPELAHVMSEYTSDMWLTVFEKVENDILNGGTGLSEADQAARHALDAARKSDANEKAYLAAQVNIVSRALSFPDFVMANLEAQMAAEVLKQENASSNEIYIADGELAQKNTQFAIEKGIDLERILRSFWELSEKMSFEFKKGVAEFILRKFEEKNKSFLIQYQGITARMQANVAAAEAVIASNKPVMEKFKIEMDGVLGEGDLIAKERDAIVKLADTEANIYKTRVEAVAISYNALTENQKAELQRGALILDKAKAELDFLLKNQLALSTQRKEILAELGKMFTQITSAALNTVQTSVGATTNNSSSVQTSWSNDKSIRESYGHDQNASENHSISHKGADIS